MATNLVNTSWRFGNRNGVTHGHTIGKRIPSEYNTWKGMRRRCLNPSNPRYALYGGRGIRVCDRWLDSFQAFLDDVGPKPSPAHSLDRIDTNGDYEPGNVRWATQQTQCRNQRRNRVVLFAGEMRTLAEIRDIAGVEGSHLNYHLKQGRTADEAVALILGKRAADKSRCVNGHELAGENLYTSPAGKPQCKICRKAARERCRRKVA